MGYCEDMVEKDLEKMLGIIQQAYKRISGNAGSPVDNQRKKREEEERFIEPLKTHPPRIQLGAKKEDPTPTEVYNNQRSNK